MTQLVPQQGPTLGEVVLEILKVTAPPVLGYMAGRVARQPELDQLVQQRDQNYRAWQHSQGQLQKVIAENDLLRVREQTKDTEIARLKALNESQTRTIESQAKALSLQKVQMTTPYLSDNGQN